MATRRLRSNSPAGNAFYGSGPFHANHSLLLVVACSCAIRRPGAAPLPGPAVSADAIGATESEENVAEFAVRGTSYAADSDQARYQRYRDLRNGGTLDLFRFTKATDSQWFNLQADHVGYRDQRFSAAINDYGKVKASFEFNQIPLFFSQDTRTLYTTTAPGAQPRRRAERTAEQDDDANAAPHWRSRSTCGQTQRRGLQDDLQRQPVSRRDVPQSTAKTGTSSAGIRLFDAVERRACERTSELGLASSGQPARSAVSATTDRVFQNDRHARLGYLLRSADSGRSTGAGAHVVVA